KQGQTVLVSYAFDALGRRVTENPGSLKDVYYSSGWQAVEERSGLLVQAQYVWSAAYVDALVERDRDADGLPADGLEERLYAQQDANYDTTALVSAAGSV